MIHFGTRNYIGMLCFDPSNFKWCSTTIYNCYGWEKTNQDQLNKMLVRWVNILFILTLVYGFVLIECCFEYSGTLRNPCTEDKCPFGAECIPSFDGRSFECSCPKCASYGDSRDSRPICGSDGRDYSSLCELNRRSCSLSRSVSVRYNGSCGNISH